MNKTKAICLTVLLTLVLVASPVVVLLLAPATYTGLIERVARDSTGLQLTLQPLEVDFFPPRVELGELRLSNPSSPLTEPLLRVARVSVSADPQRWWQNASTWWRASFNDVELRVGRDSRAVDVWQVRAEQPSRDTGTKSAEAGAADGDSIISALRAFASVQVENLDVYRLTADETHRLKLTQFDLTQDADETVNVAVSGSFKQQPLEVSGHLVLPGSDRAQGLNLVANVFGADLTVKGSMEDDDPLRGAADFRLRADDLSSLSQLLGQDFDALAPIALNGQLAAPRAGQWQLSIEGELGGRPLQLHTALTVNDSVYEIDETNVSYAESSVKGRGTVDLQAHSVAARVASTRLNLDQILSLAGEQSETEDTDPGLPLDALASWSVDLEVDLDHVRYQGYNARQLAFSVTGGDTQPLSVEGDLQGMTVSGSRPQQAGEQTSSAQQSGDAGADYAWELAEPLKFSGNLQLQADREGRRPVSARISSAGLVADMETVLPESGAVPRQGQLHARLESFDSISGFDQADSRLASLLPFEVTVSAASEGPVLNLEQFDVRVNDSQLSGHIAIDHSATPPHISGKFHSPEMDINRFRTTPTGDENNGEEPKAGDGDVIDDAPIDWDWLQAATVDLDITLDDLLFNQTHFHNVALTTKLEDGRLALDPIRADLSEGGIRGHVRIRKQDASAQIDTRLIVTGLAPADLGMKDAGLIDGGQTDILLNLDGVGASPQALADSLNGEIAVEVQSATIRNSLLEIIGSDLLLETITLINPYIERNDSSELECGAAYFAVSDGVMRSPGQLVVETGKMKIRGGGEINLREETLKIDLAPKARKGLGIGLGTLASVVRLGGTLGNPKPEADPSGILKSGASVGAAITTGGISLLAQGLFDRMSSAGGTACGKIFEKVPDTQIPEAIKVNETARR